MKTVYICGDSFSSRDPEYGPSWVDMLETHLSSTAKIINLSSIAASNLLISIQVKEAVDNQADFVILLGTACTRSEVALAESKNDSLMSRFKNNELVAFSIYRPYRSHLTEQQQSIIKPYHDMFFDLNLAIHRDECLIENSLQRLSDNRIPFLFDQGGFEHPSFGGAHKTYFEKYRANFSQVNLWNYGNTVDERPYYHIKDTHIHREVSEYYYKEIIKCL